MEINSTKSFFRFRTYSPVSLKELQYGEIFFVHKDELNDPYDTKNSSYFKGDFKIYKRLIQYVININYKGVNTEKICINEIAQFLSKESLFYDQLIEKLNSDEFRFIVLRAFNIPESVGYSDDFIKNLKAFIYKYAGANCYIASFSKDCDNPIMWSHYSNYHTGFCLCFTFEDSKIKSDEKKQNKLLQNEYHLEIVKYRKNSIKTNGFYTFPATIYGKSIKETERLKYWLYKINSFLIKSKSWLYEKEYRIIQYDSLTESINESGVNKRLVGQRILYYDQSQLTGIIFGSKMNFTNKEELRNTIITLRSQLLTYKKCLPIFVFYESKEKNTSEYNMDIKPIYALDMFNQEFNISKIKEKEIEYNKFKEFSKR